MCARGGLYARPRAPLGSWPRFTPQPGPPRRRLLFCRVSIPYGIIPQSRAPPKLCGRVSGGFSPTRGRALGPHLRGPFSRPNLHSFLPIADIGLTPQATTAGRFYSRRPLWLRHFEQFMPHEAVPFICTPSILALQDVKSDFAWQDPLNFPNVTPFLVMLLPLGQLTRFSQKSNAITHIQWGITPLFS